MIVIAENLNTRNRIYMEAIRKKDRKAIEKITEEISSKSPDYINIQTSLDGYQDEENLPYVTEVVTNTTDIPVSLDSRNIEALKRSIRLLKKPAIINYLSMDEKNPEDFFRLVKENNAYLVIRALKSTVPTTLEGKLLILENLIEMANENDIPNNRLFADPSVVHIGSGAGQEHITNTHEALLVLSQMVEPPVNTIAWITNISSASSKKVRSKLNSIFLSYLAGAGLDAAILDVMDEEVMKTVYLIRAFRNEIVFSQTDIME